MLFFRRQLLNLTFLIGRLKPSLATIALQSWYSRSSFGLRYRDVWRRPKWQPLHALSTDYFLLWGRVYVSFIFTVLFIFRMTWQANILVLCWDFSMTQKRPLGRTGLKLIWQVNWKRVPSIYCYNESSIVDDYPLTTLNCIYQRHKGKSSAQVRNVRCNSA